MGDMDEDYLLALRLQEEFNQETAGNTGPPQLVSESDSDVIGQWVPKLVGSSESTGSDNWSVVDSRWEAIDPVPDARAMFMAFNDKYFWGRLAGVEVRWSPRMTSCAGLCCYEGRGGLCSVRLSEPLLKLRPRSDFVNTLLHEMIHAYLFVTENNKDHDGHGPEFHKHLYRINNMSGSNITVYHTFHDEVASYKQHWWRCDGPCQKMAPYYGYVKRAMNRAPAPTDTWWADHQRKCAGTYTKVKEPEGFGQKKKKKKEEENKPPERPKGSRDIRDLFGSTANGSNKNGKPGAKIPELPHNVQTYQSQDSCDSDSEARPQSSVGVPSFPGEGKTLGWAGPSQGPIVRRLPGIGIISSQRPTATQASATITSAEQADGNGGSLPNTGDSLQRNTSSRGFLKRSFQEIIGDSDSDSDILFPVKQKEPKKARTEPFEDYGLIDCTPPGTTIKIPGFKSVSNRTSNPRSMPVSRAADRNKRAMELSSSEESDTDAVPLSSAIPRSKPATDCDSDLECPFGSDVRVPSVTPSAITRITIPESAPPARDSVHTAANHVVQPQAGISIPSTDTMVQCPICQARVPNSQINQHLDSCIS